MYFMVFYEEDSVEIFNTLDYSRIQVPDKQMGEFIDMLLEAQAIINEGQRRKADKERLLAWQASNPKIFHSQLAEMGIVIPIQKQGGSNG